MLIEKIHASEVAAIAADAIEQARERIAVRYDLAKTERPAAIFDQAIELAAQWLSDAATAATGAEAACACRDYFRRAAETALIDAIAQGNDCDLFDTAAECSWRDAAPSPIAQDNDTFSEAEIAAAPITAAGMLAAARESGGRVHIRGPADLRRLRLLSLRSAGA